MNVTIHYPLREQHKIILRCDHDWDKDILPIAHTHDRISFLLPKDTLYWKPCLITENKHYWAKSANQIAVHQKQHAWPYFFQSKGSISSKYSFQTSEGMVSNLIRVYTPPSYEENTKKKYPVLYMHDGGNVFFSKEAFMGNEWRADETMDLLNRMNIIEEVIVVALYPRNRMEEYTEQGYEQYGTKLIENIKTFIDVHYRTKIEPKYNIVMGSSLGGVVSFYLSWRWPTIFGAAACMSSTFGYADDLFSMVRSQPILPNIRLYLDSGWPKDNFERTRTMAALLQRKGMHMGKDLLYLTFPKGKHNETYWADRLHIPYQFLFAKRWKSDATS